LARALTPKQEAFAVTYIQTGNATEAYRRAYDAKNMASDTVNKRAAELLKHGGIAGRLAELQAPAAARAVATAERLVAEAELAALGEAKDDLTWANKLKAQDMLLRVAGAFKEDNKQKAPSVAIHVVLE
jgi:phage terminase small subunit